ncbi:MAG: hypothetical protein ISS19_17870 [Bacteroidales bacterium]|nr:hypothetical protein [Bacteroidales bacterium]
MEEKVKKNKDKYFGIGIAIGLPIGIPIGIMLDNIAIGPAIGLSIGLVIGVILESRYNKSGNDMLPAGRRKIISILLIGIIGLAVGALLFTCFLGKG